MHNHRATLLVMALLLSGSFVVWWSAGSEGQQVGVLRCDQRVPIRSLPYRIAECGSYYLADCLQGSPGAAGIVVAASDVTIDLSGHTLAGVATSLDAIEIEGTQHNVRIRGGTITGWGASGIDATDLRGGQFIDLIVDGNASDGIAAGLDCEVRSCVASENGGVGVSSFDGGCSIRATTSRGNGGGGFRLGVASIIEGCIASRNTGHGIQITTSGGDCVVRDNLIDMNTQSGIYGEQINDCLIDSNNIVDNGGHAVELASPVSGGNVIFRNVASGNATPAYQVNPVDVLGVVVNLTGGGSITHSFPWANFVH